jgi:hypothetical protein
MCIVGYDDKKYGGAFEIMNSWGEDWGDNGYCWIKYDDFAATALEAYQLIGFEPIKPDPPKPITPDPQPIKPQPEPPKPVEPKPEPPKPITNTEIEGSIKLIKSDKSEITVKLANGATRDFEIVEIEKPVYNATNAIFSGEQFRIYFTSNKAAYVYIISYGTATNLAKPIFPFKGFAAYIPSGNSEVAIPNENYYIQADKNTGTDFLTFVYSKNEIDIQAVCDQINKSTGAFISKMKKAFSGKIYFSKDVVFKSDIAGFKANSDSRYILPVTIQFEHR